MGKSIKTGLWGISLLAFILLVERGIIPMQSGEAYWFAAGIFLGGYLGIGMAQRSTRV